MLTKREIEVLQLSGKGFTQIQIASRLGISQPAVSDFYNNALNKIKDAEEVLKTAKKLKIKNAY